ncbi:hypothetical protein [Desulfosarcina cetonica]|uniref:hypothetical protein n=1 Tax=Desulfosarcina cetonica TaxID=90730 RepID=UPI00155DB510|nr:hypothetical protein [Desulfosarcina cetonica]
MPLPSRESASADERQAILRAGDRFSAQVLEVQNGRDALIAFGRFSAYARLPLPVSAGQEIQVGVESAGQGLRLFMMPTDGQTQNNPSSGPLAIDPFEMVSAKSAASLSMSALSPGTTLQARVTGFEKDGQMLLDFGGFKRLPRLTSRFIRARP